jgi:hypothetical protein
LVECRKPSDELPADFDVVLLDEVSPAIGEVSTDDETAEARGAMLAWAEVVPVVRSGGAGPGAGAGAGGDDTGNGDESGPGGT